MYHTFQFSYIGSTRKGKEQNQFRETLCIENSLLDRLMLHTQSKVAPKRCIKIINKHTYKDNKGCEMSRRGYPRDRPSEFECVCFVKRPSRGTRRKKRNSTESQYKVLLYLWNFFRKSEEKNQRNATSAVGKYVNAIRHHRPLYCI